MEIRLRCKCGRILSIDEAHAGQKGKCPGCGAVFRIPPATAGRKPEVAEASSQEKQTRAPVPTPTPVAETPREPETNKSDWFLESSPPPAQASAGTASAAPAPSEPAVPPIPTASASAPVTRCPKCANPLDSDAVVCINCGTRVKEPPPAEVKPPQKTRLPDIRKLLRDKKKVLMPVAGALGLVMVGLVVWLMLPARKPPPLPPPPPPPSPPPVETAPPTPAPEPPKFQWSGFSDAAAECQRRLALVGQALLRYREQKQAFPKTLADLVPEFIREEEISALVCPAVPAQIPKNLDESYAYIGPEQATLWRTHLLLWDKQPRHPGRAVNGFFSDGLVRSLKPEELQAVSLQKVGDTWLTPGERSVLQAFSPIVRVTNERFLSVDVLIDGEKKGAVAYGATSDFVVTPGQRIVRLAGPDNKAAETPVDASPGIVAVISLARLSSVPPIRIRLYEELMRLRTDSTGSDSAKGYQRRREGNRVVALISNEEEVRELPGQGLEVKRREGTIRGIIIRPTMRIEGLQEQPIRVSETQHLAEGTVWEPDGTCTTYLRSDLGTIAVRLEPNWRLADRAFLQPVAQRRPWLGEPLTIEGFGSEMDEGRGWSREFAEEGRVAPPPRALLKLTGSLGDAAPPIKQWVEFAAIIPLLRQAGPGQGAVPTLLRYLPAKHGEKRTQRFLEKGTDAAVEAPEMRRRVPGQITNADRAIVLLGLLGTPGDMRPLTDLLEGERRDLQAMLVVLALGRLGSGLAIPVIRAAAGSAAGPAEAVALAMMEYEIGRAALQDAIKDWRPYWAIVTMRAWPDMAGPAARANLIEAFATCRPDYFESEQMVAEMFRFAPGPTLAAARRLLADLPEVRRREGGSEKDGREFNPVVVRQFLVHRRDPAVIARLAEVANKGSETDKAEAIVALALTRDDGLVPLCVPLLTASSPSVRTAAVMALLNINTRAALDALSGNLRPDNAFPIILARQSDVSRTLGKEGAAAFLVKLWSVAKDLKTRQTRPAGSEPLMEGPEGLRLEAAPQAEYLYPEDVLAAMASLGVRSPGIAGALNEALGHKEPAVRAAAAIAQAALYQQSPEADQAAAREKVATLVRDVVPEVRVAAAQALAALCSPQHADLLKPLLTDKEKTVRAAAIAALGRIGGDAGLEALRAGLADREPEIVLAAIESVGNTRDRRFAQTLTDLLSRAGAYGEATPRIRLATILALGKIGDPVATPVLVVLLGQKGDDKDKSEELRLAIIDALGNLDDTRAVAELVKVIRTAEKDDEREAALRALARAGSVTATRALLQLVLGEESPPKDVDVGRVLQGLLKSPRAEGGEVLARFVEARGTGACDLVMQAASAAGRERNNALYAAFLRSLLRSNQAELRQRAAWGLTTIGQDEAVLPDLQDLAKRAPQDAAAALAVVLGRLARPESIADLVEVYEKMADTPRGSGAVRSQPRAIVLTALGRIGGPDAVQAIRKIMSLERDAEFLRLAIETLGQINEKEAAERLAEQYHRFHGLYKAEVVIGLGKIGHLAPKEAVEVLSRAVQEDDPRVAGAAVDALNALRVRQAKPG